MNFPIDESYNHPFGLVVCLFSCKERGSLKVTPRERERERTGKGYSEIMVSILQVKLQYKGGFIIHLYQQCNAGFIFNRYDPWMPSNYLLFAHITRKCTSSAWLMCVNYINNNTLLNRTVVAHIKHPYRNIYVYIT